MFVVKEVPKEDWPWNNNNAICARCKMRWGDHGHNKCQDGKGNFSILVEVSPQVARAESKKLMFRG